MTHAQFWRWLASNSCWPERDIKGRNRWLKISGLIRKGRPGRGGSRAVLTTPESAATLLLGMAAPKAKLAPEAVRRFRDLVTRDEDGKVVARLYGFVVDLLTPDGNAAARPAQMLLVDDLDLPMAEISYFHGDAGRMSFETFGVDLPDADFEQLWPKRSRLLRGVVIDGSVLDDIAHLLHRNGGVGK